MLTLPILALASLAVAAPFTSIRDYARAIQLADRAVAVTEADVDNFAFYAEHSGAAYCNSELAAGTAISCGGNCPTLEANGVTILGSFSGDGTGIAGYVSLDEVRGEIVLSVRGSSNIANWIANIRVDLVNTNLVSGGKFHAGFNDAWGEMEAGVTSTIAEALAAHPGFKVVATGHSLGGAVSTIGAAVLRKAGTAVDIYTFGAPRIGNVAVSDFITAQSGAIFRITHLDDPVPKLPPIFLGYAHVSPEYWLSVSESTGEDYPIAEIKVCEGSENTECNASTGGLNVNAHSSYFGPISDCTRAAGVDATDMSDEDMAQVEAKVDAWAQEDRELIARRRA